MPALAALPAGCQLATTTTMGESAVPEMISIQCSSCGKRLKAKAPVAGKTVKCPGCGESFTAQAGGADAPEAPAPAERGSATPGRSRRRGARNREKQSGGGGGQLRIVIVCAVGGAVMLALLGWLAVGWLKGAPLGSLEQNLGEFKTRYGFSPTDSYNPATFAKTQWRPGELRRVELQLEKGKRLPCVTLHADEGLRVRAVFIRTSPMEPLAAIGSPGSSGTIGVRAGAAIFDYVLRKLRVDFRRVIEEARGLPAGNTKSDVWERITKRQKGGGGFSITCVGQRAGCRVELQAEVSDYMSKKDVVSDLRLAVRDPKAPDVR
jgi:hypothetical protein